jgi:hypothetical protein
MARVLDPAELCALPGERPWLLHLEPGVVRVPRDGVDLAAECGDPPTVDDVVQRRGDLEPHRTVHGDAHRVDCNYAVGIRELPVELPPLDVDPHLWAGGSRGGDIVDARQFVEREDRDRDEDQQRDGRPSELEVQVTPYLRSLGIDRAAAVAVLDDEDDERDLDDDEDQHRKAHHEPVDGLDPLTVRRVRPLRREPSVSRERDAREHQCCKRHETGKDEEPGAHGWHSTKPWPNAPSSICHRTSVSLSKSS